MSKVTAPVHEARERSLDGAGQVFEATRAKRAPDALTGYEVMSTYRLHTLDLIGAESVFFLDTWAL